MLLSLMNMLIFGMAGFVLMYAMYRPLLNKFTLTQELSLKILPFPYIFGLYIAGTIAAYCFAGDKDFVEPLTLARAFLPLVFAGLIYVTSLLFSEMVFGIVVAAAVAFTVLLQPVGMAIELWGISPYIMQLLFFLFGVAFCLGMRIFNILPHTLVIELSSVLFGICILCFVGASPLFVALCAAVLIGVSGAFLSLNYYNVKMDFDDGACVAIAYLVCNLMLLNIGEFSFPSCVIFTMLLWAELVMALYRKYILSQGGALRENTSCYAGADVYTLQGLSANVLRVCAVLLFIGWFQLFSVNQYSLLIVSFCLALWLGNALGAPQPTSLKEINQEFVNELKQNIEETKNLLSRNKKDNQ
ncbi:MAG: hypothetical protein IJ770_05260 [Alphaproteobacteria bacterium]|nr:hypothetical protein [Alphaproteobacteria bacterium]